MPTKRTVCFCKTKSNILSKILICAERHILDLYCIWLLNTVPFCENYAKLYFDPKQNRDWMGREVKIFGALFSWKMCPFWPILIAALEICPGCIIIVQYPLASDSLLLVQSWSNVRNNSLKHSKTCSDDLPWVNHYMVAA